MRHKRRNSLNKDRKKHAGRPGPKQFGAKSPASPEPNGEDPAPAAHSSPPEAQVSFFITKAQKAKLREIGYSDGQIEQMKPAEAHRILGLE